MLKKSKSMLIGLALSAIAFLPVTSLSTAPRKSGYAQKKSYSAHSPKKTYSKKQAYEGYGHLSTVNGRPKYKIAAGHVKKTEKGYTYVNPYAKSK